MKKYEFVGKTEEEAREKAFRELDIKENDAFVSVNKEEKGGLFKAKKVEINVVKKEDIMEYIRSFLKDITKLMGIDVNIETKVRNEMVTLTLYSENNAILIGKNGRTMESLSVIARQAVFNELGFFYNFSLDVSEYKAKQQKNIERDALRVAREVASSKVDATLDPMNSYERRLVHAVLNDHKYVYTESVGEEPKRCVVIKAREE